DRGLIEHSESSALNWLSAAVRAKSVQGDPVRVFLGIIRGKLWSHVTGEQEERARQALVHYREREPFRFRERLRARSVARLLGGVDRPISSSTTVPTGSGGHVPIRRRGRRRGFTGEDYAPLAVACVC